MSFIRTLRYHHFHALLKLNNPSQRPTNPIHRYSSLSAQFQHKIDTESIDSKDVVAKNKKPLNLLFKEAVGLSEKLEHSESEGESGNEGLKKKLRKLEIEVRRLREDKRRILKEDKGERENLKKEIKRDDGVSKVDSKHRRLYALFSEKNVDAHDKNLGKEYYKRVEEPIVYKELSSDMAFFANHLYKQGYFKDANFLPRNKFEATCFENNYGRDFLKFAAEKFGKDNQEIAKWLSGNDLKKVALFGCPSLSRKNIFSAKTLRTFFKIQEDTVCSKCVLKQSCKFVNQSIWKGNTKTLDLAVVMRVITLYALEAVPPELVVPDEVKASVSRLLKEILHLSETIS